MDLEPESTSIKCINLFAIGKWEQKRRLKNMVYYEFEHRTDGTIFRNKVWIEDKRKKWKGRKYTRTHIFCVNCIIKALLASSFWSTWEEKKRLQKEQRRCRSCVFETHRNWIGFEIAGRWQSIWFSFRLIFNSPIFHHTPDIRQFTFRIWTFLHICDKPDF